LELRGSFAHDPARGRARAGEPVPTTPLGDPPSRLDAQERAAWAEISATCCPGVLTGADRLVLELASRLLAESWDVGREFKDSRRRQLHMLLGSFGMNPSDRSRVTAVQPKPPSRLAMALA